MLQKYNYIMLRVWLIVAIGSFILITILGIMNGFKGWISFYAVSLTAGIMYLGKRFMIKRFEKHMEFLQQKEGNTRKK